MTWAKCVSAGCLVLSQPAHGAILPIIERIGEIIGSAVAANGVDAAFDKFKPKPRNTITRDQAIALQNALQTVQAERDIHTANLKRYLASIRKGNDPKLTDNRNAAVGAATSLQRGLLALNTALGAIDASLKIFDRRTEEMRQGYTTEKTSRVQKVRTLESMSDQERAAFEKAMDTNGPLLDTAAHSFSKFLKDNYKPDK